MNYELFTGLRYLRAKRRNGFISFISGFSMIGIALGVWLLLVVISVMNGFEKELRERILSAASHATISGVEQPLQDWSGVVKTAEKLPLVKSAAPYIEGEGMIKLGSELSGALLRGVSPAEESKVSDFATHMTEGRFQDLQAGRFGMIIGQELADKLGVGVGDKLDLMIPQASITPAGVVPRFRRFNVVGVFKLGMYEYDQGMVLIHLNDAQALLRMDTGVTGVRLKLHDMFQAREVVRELVEVLGGEYYVSDWTRSHANFFKAVATEKMVMFLILSAIVLVAAFNIVSTMVMVVEDKRADIAILRTMGARPASIMQIFIVQGAFIGVVGTVVGTLVGVLTVLNISELIPLLEQLAGRKFINAQIYYISELPAELRHWDVIKIVSLSFVMTLIATLYPARAAAKTDPAEALRYE
jgi:lipoprotein-releasing system permease protein